MKTILIIGCGSIGSRHARNTKLLGAKNIILCDADIPRAKKLRRELGSSYFYSGWLEAWENHPDIEAAIVATPTSRHLEPALFAAKRGIHIFMEKPISHTLKGVDELISKAKQNGLVGMMGQSYRFHEGFLKLKGLLENGAVGKIYHVNYSGGQYLPDWHPERDYRKEYAARKSLGGGVMLTSMSHGFDTIQWLFGRITEMIGWKAKLGDLDIDVEDSAFVTMKTERDVIVQVSTDFLQKSDEHKMTIVGEKGNIEADFKEHTIIIQKTGRERVVTYRFDGNKRYLEELKHFFGLVAERRIQHDLDLSAGKRILELIFHPKIQDIQV